MGPQESLDKGVFLDPFFGEREDISVSSSLEHSTSVHFVIGALRKTDAMR